MTTAASTVIFVRHVDVDAMRANDHQPNRDLVAFDFDDSASVMGTLDQMLAVFGRAHEQLLAIQAARTIIPARAVLGTDGSLSLETSVGHGLGWLDVGGAQGFKPGDELLIQWDDDGDGWEFVRWIRDVEDIAGIDFDGGYATVVVNAPEDSE